MFNGVRFSRTLPFSVSCIAACLLDLRHLRLPGAPQIYYVRSRVQMAEVRTAFFFCVIVAVVCRLLTRKLRVWKSTTIANGKYVTIVRREHKNNNVETIRNDI